MILQKSFKYDDLFIINVVLHNILHLSSKILFYSIFCNNVKVIIAIIMDVSLLNKTIIYNYMFNLKLIS